MVALPLAPLSSAGARAFPFPDKPMTASERSSLSSEAALRFRRIVDANFQFVWRYLRGLGVLEAHVDDAAQQVFLVVLQKLDAIEEGRERSFVVGTALGVAANARRSQSRRREVGADASLYQQRDDAPNPEEAAQSRQAIDLLDRFLASLPDELRTVFILFELEGMTMANIAEATNTPAGTVASRLRRAREEFHAASKRIQATARRAEGAS